MRILIAEDEPISRKFIYLFLSAYGECDLTIDGAEAIEAFHLAIKEHRPYDLVCLDIMMPGINGIDALKQIRELEVQALIADDKRAKIIMTTALNNIDHVQEAFEYGSEGYITKPINTQKIIELLKEFQLIQS